MQRSHITTIATMGISSDAYYTAASQDGKWGVIDVDGNVLVPFIYDRAYHSGYKNAIGLECCSGATIY